MQNLQDIHDKIFFETKSILETLCKINSKDELLAKQDLFTEVTDRIAFLRILEKNEDHFAQILIGENPEDLEMTDNQIIDEATEHVSLNTGDFSEDITEEEVLFTNELNDFEEELQSEEKWNEDNFQINSIEHFDEELHQTSEPDLDEIQEREIPLIVEQENDDYAERVAQKERDLEEMEERRRKIVEFTKHETLPETSNEKMTDAASTPAQNLEKKFRLANIKGLKVVQQLFDIEPEEEEKPAETALPDPGSLVKSNVETDYMQAEKKKPEFKLDLNDKVAFSKILFGGDDQEMKSTIEKLNSFDKLEDAKQYLSEVYYQKDWSKKDEFAQRLWNLVESKF